MVFCDRYLWIDLSAGPVEISALKDSSNLVNQWTLPRLEQYGSSEDFRLELGRYGQYYVTVASALSV